MSTTVRNPLMRKDCYDKDAALSEAGSEENSDFDVNDISHAPDENDRQVLIDAEEEEHLLGRPSPQEKLTKAIRKNDDTISRKIKRTERRAKRVREEAEGGGNAELIYKMEGGYRDSSSRSSSESLVLDIQKWSAQPARKSVKRLIAVAIGVILIFLILVYGAHNASNLESGLAFSNGTHAFGPTTILISLDGFRADFLQRGLTPAMNALIESGVSPLYMLPSFPSLTFPNHFTMVTGLYPESHGIVSNQFWDPNLEEEFYYTNISNSMQPKWWNAEPLWVTAEKAGLKTAIHMWPGSEAHIHNKNPTYVDKYNGSEVLAVKVDQILQWLDMPQKNRPQFIGAYVPNVDADGHKYGPNSTEIRATIVEVDSMLTDLIEGLFHRNLTEIVNIVIVSDHGMATTSTDRIIQLDDFIDMSLVDHIDGWPLRGLRLRNPERDVPIFYQQLLTASEKRNFDVYTLDTMPDRYHFSKNDRIAPLWVVPHTGWVVIEKDDFDLAEAKVTGKTYKPLGLHGYDHEHPLMRAIFIGRGPAFPHKPNSRVPVFQNIELYNIICDSLGIEPVPNNGTLRLPFVTDGFHSDFKEPIEIPNDPVEPTPLSLVAPDASNVLPTMTGSSFPEQTTSAIGKDQPVSNKTTQKGSWWDFLHNQIEKAKEWAKELVDSIKNNKPGAVNPTE